LNALVGAKVSIVSRKVQTTRARVLGIAIEGPAQIIFVDTPGIFAPRKRLDRAMVAAAWQGADDADLVALLVDAYGAVRTTDRETEAIVAKLKESGRKAVLVLNKVDLVNPPQLLGLADRLNREGVFTDIFMISALTGDGVGDLRKHFAKAMPPGPWLYPEDQISDAPLRMLAAEITREKIYDRLHDELPYQIAVETTAWTEQGKAVRVEQTIFVERDSQKRIVLGKGGAMIKQLSMESRRALSEIVERPVHLFLFVKVREGWGDDPARYRDLGLTFPKE